MRFSVVISTYNRMAGLKRTLEAVRYQTHDDFEVVVVNGPSTDETGAMLATIDDVRVVDCPVARLSVSRNLGIAATAGEVVAFIDDDAIPESNWLSDLDPAYEEGVGGVGGIVFNHTGVELQYRYAVHGRTGNPDFRQRRPLARFMKPGADPFLYLQGTNMSFRRSCLEEIGGFDEGIEYNHDDVEICLQLIDRGYQIRAVDGGAVHHRYLASHIRNSRRWVFDPYKPVKDRAYFALMHGRRTRSAKQVIREIEEYADWVRRGAREDCQRGSCTQEELEYFLGQVDASVRDGIKQGLEGNRRSTQIPPPDAAAFRPFGALRPPEGRITACLVSFEYPPEDFGGVGRYTADLATGLAARGHEVHVMTRSADWPRVDFEDGVWLHRTVTHGVGLKELGGHPLASNLYLLASDYHDVDALHRRIPIDIVFAPLWLCEGGICQLDGRFATVTTLQTVHKTIAKILKSWEGNPHIEAMIKLEEATLRRAGYLHANSQASLDTVRADFDIGSAVARVVPHGLGDHLPDYPVPPPDPDRVELLFVGRLERRKGVDVLLEVVPRLLEEFPNLHVTLAGQDTANTDMPKTYRESFEATMAGRPQLSRRVTFAGFLADEELYRHYAACDIFCAPSRYESFGLVLLEAMMFGKPVVGCAAGGMPEVVEEGGNGFLAVPGDVQSLAECLRKLIADPALRRQFGQRSRDLYEQNFNLDIVARRMVETFQDAALEARSQRDKRLEDSQAGGRLREGVIGIIMEAAGLPRKDAEAAASALLDQPEMRSPFIAAIRKIWSKPPEEFVKELYRLLFGREADADGLAYYTAALRHGTSRAAVVRTIASSAEGWGYVGEADWLKALEPLEAQDRLQEIEALWPAPSGAFVRSLYRTLLGREPDVMGWLRQMVSLRGGRRRLDLLRSIANSVEAAGKGVIPTFIDELAERMKHAREDPRAIRIQQAMNAGNSGFVEAAYRVILGREPDPEGFQHNQRRLRLGVRRGQVLSDLARSDEAVARATDTSFLLGVEGGLPGVAEMTLGGWMTMVRRTMPPRVRMKGKSAGRRLARTARTAGSRMASRVKSASSKLARPPGSIASLPPSRVIRTDGETLRTAIDQETRHARSVEEREDQSSADVTGAEESGRVDH
jgi:glycogen synthase